MFREITLEKQFQPTVHFIGCIHVFVFSLCLFFCFVFMRLCLLTSMCLTVEMFQELQSSSVIAMRCYKSLDAQTSCFLLIYNFYMSIKKTHSAVEDKTVVWKDHKLLVKTPVLNFLHFAKPCLQKWNINCLNHFFDYTL